MATRKLGAKVELSGEKEYKQALTDLNNGNRVLASEMKKLQAEYQGNSDSVEFLTKKGDILERQLSGQKEKVETLRQALENAAKTYGEGSAQAMKYQAKLNDAEAAQYELQHAIEENNEAIASQGSVWDQVGGMMEEVAGKLGVKIPDGAKKALSGMQGMSSGTVAAMTAAAAAITALYEGVKALHEMTLQSAADVDELITKSMTSGVSTKSLQELKYAENLIDVSVDTIAGSLTKLTKNMAAANNGSEEMAQKFADLGISITDTTTGELRNAEDVFYELIDALGGMENQTERDATAMDILGKSAQELNPLILQGSGALQELAKEAEAVGYVLDESQIAKLGEVDDSYQRMQLTIEAVQKQMSADFAPASKAAMDLFSDAVQKAGEFLEKSGLIENLASIIESLVNILRTGGEILTGIPGFDEALNGLKVTLGAVAQFMAVIADSADLVKSILSLDFSGVKNALGFGYGSGNANNLQRVTMQQNGTWNQYASFYGRNAGGTDAWRGGLTWLGEAGPELVDLPQGSRVYSNQESRNIGGDTFYISIDAANVKEFNDIVEIAKSARVRSRMR